jgi:hypothetical protein
MSSNMAILCVRVQPRLLRVLLCAAHAVLRILTQHIRTDACMWIVTNYAHTHILRIRRNGQMRCGGCNSENMASMRIAVLRIYALPCVIINIRTMRTQG